MKRRVVITGLGVVAPNGVGIPAFLSAIKQDKSAVRFDEQLAELGFSCCISAKPKIDQSIIDQSFEPLELKGFNSNGIMYGVIAGMEAWQDAGLSLPNENAEPDWNTGTIFGTSTSGVDKFRDSIYKVDEKQSKKLGSTTIAQTMASGISAYLGGKLGLGNQVTTNSSACTTGTESILMAYERVSNGHAERMIAGGTSDSGPYIWAGFDAIRVCTFKNNNQPEKGSRPMSATASGFVPGAGAGALMLESLDNAIARGAKIYAEVLGGNVNSGGQRGNGSMTAPNSEAVQRCIKQGMTNAGIEPREIDAINAHLTATSKDAMEIQNWSEALQLSGTELPYINALKSHIGHCISAAGSIESIAAVLQLRDGFLFPNLNCEDLHPDILAIVDSERIPQQFVEKELNIIIKASFGFGDVNACVVFKKWDDK